MERFIIAAGTIPPEATSATIRFPQRGGVVKLEVGPHFTALAEVPAHALGRFLARARDVLVHEGFSPRLVCTLPVQIN